MIKKWLKNLEGKTFKNYTHFDINKKIKDSEEKYNFFESFFCCENIIKNNFFPYIRYEINEKRFTLHCNEEYEEEKLFNPEYQHDENHFYWEKKKIRPITYASHKDSEIYSFYSFLLGEKYDIFLKKEGLDKNVLAYRTVPISETDKTGKNNIHFAKDSFENIVKMSNSIVIAFDISGFFDNLNHIILKNELIKVLGGKVLSKDWYKVFTSLVKFSYINKKDINENNLIKEVGKYHKIVDIDRFNSLKKKYESLGKTLVHTNCKGYSIDNKGIPQGTPISGMLANIYMNSFDIILKNYSKKLGGKYYRYSDDILLIIPYKKDHDFLESIKIISDFTLKNIDKELKLKINNKKTEISIFKNGKIWKNVEYNSEDDIFNYKNEKHIQGFQYLGFTFDGNKVLIRNKTLSNFYKKLVKTVKRLSHLNDENNEVKTGKILLGQLNRKFLYNGEITGYRYERKDNKWILNKNGKGYYLGFLSYGYNAFDLFDNFCKKNNIQNGIKKQLAGHRKKYNNLLIKMKIK